MWLKHCVLLVVVLLPMLATSSPLQEDEALSSRQAVTKRIIGYFTNWAQYRPGTGKATPDKMDPRHFTNIIYAFVDWDSNYQLTTYDWKDSEFFGLMQQWRTQNPSIKISLAIGGWPSPTGPRAAREFSQMSSTAANRKKFIDGTLFFLRKNNLDGIDIDWEYPEPGDRNNYIALIQEMRAAFNAEASGDSRLLLSTAVAASASYIPNYGWSQTRVLFDWVTVMAYDFHGNWDNNAAHHSSKADSLASVNNYIAAGVPAVILSLGLPFYGRGNVPAGPYTGEAGYWAYYEVRDKINSGWTVTTANGGPRASGQGMSIYFDNAASLAAKASDAKTMGLGGVSFWAIDLDLFQTTFSTQDRFELTKAVRTAFL